MTPAKPLTETPGSDALEREQETLTEDKVLV